MLIHAFRPGLEEAADPCALPPAFISDFPVKRPGGRRARVGRREKTQCELVHPPGNSQKKKKKKGVPGNCLAGRGQRAEPSSILWLLIGGRKRKSLCKLAALSPPGLLPLGKHRARAPTSCRRARASLIKRPRTCHGSLGGVCRTPLPPRPSPRLRPARTPRTPRTPDPAGREPPRPQRTDAPASLSRQVMETFNFHHARPAELCFKSL